MSTVTSREFAAAVNIMSRVIRDFPQTVEGQAFVTHALEKYVSTREQLNWLTETACERMRRFSLPELRGIFCMRFRPADGREEYPAETPGFTANEQESGYYERLARETDRKLLEWRREAKLLSAGEPQEPLSLPALRLITDPAPSAAIPDKPAPARPQAPKVSDQDLTEVIQRTPRRTDAEQLRLLAELQAQLNVRT